MNKLLNKWINKWKYMVTKSFTSGLRSGLYNTSFNTSRYILREESQMFVIMKWHEGEQKSITFLIRWTILLKRTLLRHIIIIRT